MRCYILGLSLHPLSNFIEFGISVIEFGTLCALRANTAVHLGVEASHSKVVSNFIESASLVDKLET